MALNAQTPRKEAKHIKYVGTRPKNDQDNHIREKLCHLVRDVGCFFEIYPEKFYMVYLAKNENPQSFCDQHSSSPHCPFIFWSTHNKPSLTYVPFNMDFGPFNLATTHQFLSQVKVWLDTQAHRDSDKCIVIVLDDQDTKRKLNLTLLVAIAAMVLLNLTDQEVLQRLDFFMMYKNKPGETKKELVFREKKKFTDVSGNQSVMTLTLEDCIKAFYAAIQAKFYDYYEFDPTEYLFYETVMSGDLNWIVPGKLLAFAGPSDDLFKSIMAQKHPPDFYYPYFKDHNVTSIVRLNESEYDSSSFKENGFDHHDLIFPDGYPPTSPIAAKFIKIVDEAMGAVAVHCYAGIGRTGTLIAAYLIARYDFTPQMAIAWTRICRPGSVIGEQQDWLFTKFDRLSFAHQKNSPTRPARNKKNKTATNLQLNQPSSTPTAQQLPIRESVETEQNPNSAYVVAEKTYGQAKALMLAKKQREHLTRPCTRNSNQLLKNLEVGDGNQSSSNTLDKDETITLDLGRTVPLMLHMSDLENLEDGQNPKFYRLKDNKYEWKVKFPRTGYVALRHDRASDLQAAHEYGYPIERLYREPKLEFKYEADEKKGADGENNGVKEVPKRLKPVVYYKLFSVWDT